VVVLAQSPSDAAYSSMPQSVPDNVGTMRAPAPLSSSWSPGWVLPGIGAPAGARRAVGACGMEVEMAELDEQAMQAADSPGVPAGFGCPECRSMSRIDGGALLPFRCLVGHAWSSSGLLIQQAEAMEGAVWMALPSLEERSALNRDLARRSRERGSELSADRFLEQAEDSVQSAELVRELIDPRPSLAPLSTFDGSPAAVGDV